MREGASSGRPIARDLAQQGNACEVGADIVVKVGGDAGSQTRQLRASGIRGNDRAQRG